MKAGKIGDKAIASQIGAGVGSWLRLYQYTECSISKEVHKSHVPLYRNGFRNF